MRLSSLTHHLLLTLLLLSLFSSPLFANSDQLHLTKEEQTWLKQHPIIRVGVDQNWPPFDYVDHRLNHQGIASDYLNILSHLLNIKFEISADLWKNVFNGIRTGQLDILACASNTTERQQFLNFTQPYIEIDTVFVTRIDQPSINSLLELNGATVALPKDTYIHELLKNNTNNTTFLFVESNQEALQAVSLGKADVYVGNLAVVSHFIEEDLLTNLKVDNRLPEEKSKLAIAIRKNLPLLYSILQKGLNTISEEQHKQIARKWIPFNHSNLTKSELTLTTEEKNWLKHHPDLQIGIDPTWPPIEYIDTQSQKYQGIASEYIAYLESALKIKTHYDPNTATSENHIVFHNVMYSCRGLVIMG